MAITVDGVKVAGLSGRRGPAGPRGEEGKSAYQLAVEGGFVGTETMWLASLVGPEGPQGERGERGEVGPEGPEGPQGERGETGLQGPPGEDGAGVPEGGTTGQWLAKASNENYDYVWKDSPFVEITQEEYDALSEKKQGVLYIIVEPIPEKTFFEVYGLNVSEGESQEIEFSLSGFSTSITISSSQTIQDVANGLNPFIKIFGFSASVNKSKQILIFMNTDEEPPIVIDAIITKGDGTILTPVR